MHRPQEPAYEKPRTRQARVALNVAIEGINLVKDLVPLELAKGVLSAVAGVLTLFQVCTFTSFVAPPSLVAYFPTDVWAE